MKIATGKYIGTGSARSVITAGVAPDVVFVKGAGATDAYVKMGTFASADSIALDAGSFVTTRITALNSDGFSVGTHADVNSNGTTYYWVAFEMESSDSKNGTYTGDGTASQVITGVGFQADMLLVAENNAPRNWKTDDMPAALSLRPLSNAVVPAIIALAADGFTVGVGGTGLSINDSEVTYHYFASKNVSGKSNTVKYTGDGNDNRSITGAGFRPGVVFLQGDAPAASKMVLRFTHQSGDLSFEIDEAEQADKIQALETDGFQVGQGDSVNRLTGTPDYFAWLLDVRRQAQGVVNIIG